LSILTKFMCIIIKFAEYYTMPNADICIE